MTKLHLIIARDMQENITVYQPFCNHRSTEENVLENIAPLSGVPLQELLSEEDVLTTFGIDHKWLVAKIEEMMEIPFDETEKRYVGILVILANVYHWATVVLVWGERYDARQQIIYGQLMRDFLAYKSEGARSAITPQKKA